MKLRLKRDDFIISDVEQLILTLVTTIRQKFKLATETLKALRAIRLVHQSIVLF